MVGVIGFVTKVYDDTTTISLLLLVIVTLHLVLNQRLIIRFSTYHVIQIKEALLEMTQLNSSSNVKVGTDGKQVF